MMLADRLTQRVAAVERGLQLFFDGLDFGHSAELGRMLRYHLGWEDGLGSGKRLRPALLLLCAGACGGDDAAAMPAALAVEFLHNFTLIHDDIEDRSPTRHGRPTLWTRWGVAQAVNAGDALFSIAQLALLDLHPDVALRATREMNHMCLQLTRGQYLDIAFEDDEGVELETYLAMIRGKTAALLAFCTSMGGLAARAEAETITRLGNFGEHLGMAFQIQDDALGIWGDPAVTGKSAASDLLAHKKSLPVLYGLRESAEFQALWGVQNPTSAQITAMAGLLEACGAAAYARGEARAYMDQAFEDLEVLFSDKNADAGTLVALTHQLLDREM